MSLFLEKTGTENKSVTVPGPLITYLLQDVKVEPTLATTSQTN
jgi:hypothetical protein